MEYREAVAEIKRLETEIEQGERRLDSAKYEQGRLIFEQLSGGTTQRQLAADTGIPKSTLQVRAKVWERFGQQADRPAYADAYVIANENLGEVDPSQAQRQKYEQEARSTVRNMPPEQKAAVVREALDDQDVAVRVLRDPHTRRNMTEAREQVVREIETDVNHRIEIDPTAVAIREATRTLNIEAYISRVRFWLAEIARQVQELDDRDPQVMERLARQMDEVDLAMGWVRTAIEGGRVNDDDLARLLEGGA